MTILKPGYELNPATGKQRKICRPGYYRDPESGRCKKIRPILQPLVLGYGKASRSVLKSSFGKKCGFGTCAACMN